VERIATVAGTDVDDDAAERLGACGDLTDVDVEKPFTSELTHAAMLTLARGVHGLVRVLHQPLRAADGAWDVEALVEVAEILRGLERLLEGGLRETQGRPQPFELAGVDRGACYSR